MKNLHKWFLGGLSIFILLAVYAFLIEPHWVEVTHYSEFAAIRTPIRIAHLSDLHIRKLGWREKKVLKILEEERPDLIVVTGDTIDNEKNIGVVKEFFSALKPPLGTFVVLGNWENWLGKEKSKGVLGNGSTLLVNEAKRVRDDIRILGFDDGSSGEPNLGILHPEGPTNEYCLALYHAPGLFEKVAGRCEMSLAGHSHGGQVRLPFIGAVILPSYTRGYVSGWYEEDKSKLYVSRGIGTSILPVRFMARPEVMILHLQPIP